jgi:hypothetical protein
MVSVATIPKVATICGKRGGMRSMTRTSACAKQYSLEPTDQLRLGDMTGVQSLRKPTELNPLMPRVECPGCKESEAFELWNHHELAHYFCPSCEHGWDAPQADDE